MKHCINTVCFLHFFSFWTQGLFHAFLPLSLRKRQPRAKYRAVPKIWQVCGGNWAPEGEIEHFSRKLVVIPSD